MNQSLPLPESADRAAHWPNQEPAPLAYRLAHQPGLLDAPLLVVCASTEQAIQLGDALKYFHADPDRIALFPDYETLPYDLFSPPEDLISSRLRTLYRLVRGEPVWLLCSIGATMNRLPPRSFLTARSLILQRGDRLPMESFSRSLVDSGYQRVDSVTRHGEYALRGSLLDLFPSGSNTPYRIELFDDEVESIRSFDPDTQLTVDRIDSIDLLPAREHPLDRDSIREFQNRWHQAFHGDPRDSTVYREIGRGHSPQGIECYLPLFFDEPSTLFDYLHAETRLVIADGVHAAAERHWAGLSERYEQYSVNPERPLLPPATAYVPTGAVFARVQRFARIVLKPDDPAASTERADETLPDLALDYRADLPAHRLATAVEKHARVLLCAESAGRREVLLETLGRSNLKPVRVESWEDFVTGAAAFAIGVAPVQQSFRLPGQDWLIVAEDSLLGDRVRQPAERGRRGAPAVDPDLVIRNLTELQPGAPVVHVDHGIGRYTGLQTLTVEGLTNEFLCLEYAGNNKLYVPVTSLGLISRYSGADSEHAPLHRLGSDQWEKIKRRVTEQVNDTAAELLDLYSKRMARPGRSMGLPDDWERFCAAFPFEPTPDQQRSIDAVVEDLAAPRPMDRLICGDVGFGKTEIAMRAAFIACRNNYQVLVLVPTTLLARQHFDSFRDRFADWPLQIDSVSRLKSDAEQQEVLQRFNDGKLDILIGTHKLLHASPAAERLGLVVVDEEHRFGVRQKERLKTLKSDVDMLTLTATPIPRTLNMAMASLRDLSIIGTPPVRRLAIKTFVRPYESRVVREAMLREILRGGQVYYLHNEVKTIARTAEKLRELLPEADIQVAHGQMRERELERIIGDFYHHRFQILVCTTIIETGIDIPNANTILIDRADKFGLAQLHQLRGRVGRSHHQAYAYLLTPDPRAMTRDAVKRLEAIEAADHLGCGFTLATHDLEIRGAGELLGEEQSGQIESVGFELYQQLLERAVRNLQRGGDEAGPETADAVEIDLRIPALIPEHYLPDVGMRLSLYKRIAGCESAETLEQLKVEVIDRFGLLPEPLQNLFRQADSGVVARRLGVRKIEAGPTGGRLLFTDRPAIEPMQIISLIQQAPECYRFDGSNTLRFRSQLDQPGQRLEFVEKLLSALESGT